MSEPAIVNVLWTGGWDSSYRVLDLALVHKVAVQPHYIIDIDRLGTLHELRAIRSMRTMIRERNPAAAECIGPLRITAINDIAPDSTVDAHYSALRRRRHLGGQYAFLSRYAREHELDGLELSVHVDDAAAYVLAPEAGNVEATGDAVGPTWRLARVPADPNAALFAPFAFPLLEVSKVEMRERARQHGFLDILERSWFCHLPIAGQPCGYCMPCVYAMDEGMGDRLPPLAHVRYRLRKVLYPLRVVKEHPHLVRARLFGSPGLSR